MPSGKKPIVPLWADSIEQAVSLVNFRTQMLPYAGKALGPKDGVRRVNPVDVWLSNPDRILIQGLRMRPDRECPTFEDEDGNVWLNTYRPPNLGEAREGEPSGGRDLMEQLLPDERERKWFTQWLAYKMLYPHVPGPAVIMVARDFGTGRGTFAQLLKRMFGERYVVSVPFKIFAGLNYQSQYNDWGLDALFAIVNESSAFGEQSPHRARHDVYEHLKETIEPRAEERLYIRKGEGATRAVASTSCIIATNNPDVIPLPPDDRRFAVLTNGRPRDPAFWDHVNAWMLKRENIAAFAQWLGDVDLSTYDPYAPPIDTFAKAEMSSYNLTALDRLLREALDIMDGFFVPEQVLVKMNEIKMRDGVDLPDAWKEVSKRQMRKIAHVVRYGNKRKVSPTIGGRRYDVLHMDRDIAERFADHKGIRELLAVNGNVFRDRGPGGAVVALAAHKKAAPPEGDAAL